MMLLLLLSVCPWAGRDVMRPVWREVSDHGRHPAGGRLGPSPLMLRMDRWSSSRVGHPGVIVVPRVSPATTTRVAILVEVVFRVVFVFSLSGRSRLATAMTGEPSGNGIRGFRMLEMSCKKAIHCSQSEWMRSKNGALT